jgi:hypothetical protein
MIARDPAGAKSWGMIGAEMAALLAAGGASAQTPGTQFKVVIPPSGAVAPPDMRLAHTNVEILAPVGGFPAAPAH